jgi:hypothetical protein
MRTIKGFSQSELARAFEAADTPSVILKDWKIGEFRTVQQLAEVVNRSAPTVRKALDRLVAGRSLDARTGVVAGRVCTVYRRVK